MTVHTDTRYEMEFVDTYSIFDINKGGNFLRMGMKFAQYKNKKHQKIHKP